MPPGADAKRAVIVAAKQQHPDMGTRRLADVLRRFDGLGVSEATVRRILHEEGLMQSRPPEVEKAPRTEVRGVSSRQLPAPPSSWFSVN